MHARSLRHALVGGLLSGLLSACAPEYGEAEEITSFAVLRASSSATAYEAEATFLSPYRFGDCSTSPVVGGCVITQCRSEPPESERVAAGTLTIQGRETVVLDEANEYRAGGERSLFSAGDDVLLDLVGGNGVPSARRTLEAPSGTSLSSPPPGEEPSVLELKRGYGLGLEWTPGKYGFFRVSLRAGLVAVACEWDIADGVGIVGPDFIDQLPASDGTDSSFAVWTEQSDVVRNRGWEFLFLLQGDVSGAGYSSFYVE
jgi:hypothetical protein